ncbi:MAG: nucleotide exchange factor GrpE [bacterium]
MSIENRPDKSNGSVSTQADSKSHTRGLKRRGGKKPPVTARTSPIKKKIAALEAERDGLKDQLMRTAAEFENYKKRRENEFIQLIATSNADLISQLLPILDDFERSMKSAQESKNFQSFYTGVELIFKNLLGVLERQGVKPIEAVGQKFDPELHEALLQVEGGDSPADMVVEEHLRGYKMHDRVLRHSQVLVSK